jgi:hypothetical protein
MKIEMSADAAVVTIRADITKPSFRREDSILPRAEGAEGAGKGVSAETAGAQRYAERFSHG